MKKAILILALVLYLIDISAQSVFVNQPGFTGPCFFGEEFVPNGTINNRNAYAFPNTTAPTFYLEWSGTQWEIFALSPTGSKVLNAITTTDSSPKPPDDVTATNNGTPWTAAGSCTGTFIVNGSGTQNGVNSPCNDMAPPNLTCPSLDFNTATVSINISSSVSLVYETSFTLKDASGDNIIAHVSPLVFGLQTYSYNLPCDTYYNLTVQNERYTSPTNTVYYEVKIDGVTVIGPNKVEALYASTAIIVPTCILTDPSNCAATVNELAPTVSDNCTMNPTVTYALTGATTGSGNSDASGTLFNEGTTTLTYTATDAAGNNASCSVDISVRDDQNPTANCPNDQTATSSPGQCGAVVNFSIPAPSDNCPGATTTSLPASGSFFPVGTIPVTVTATDIAGLTGTCTFNVIVTETENPTINCPADITVGNDPGQPAAVVNYPNPAAFDNCSSAPGFKTELSLGDIAFSYLSIDQNEGFSFVLLVDVAAGTTISFALGDWSNTNGLFDQGTLIWTANSNLFAGEVVNIYTGNNPLSYPGTVTGQMNLGSPFSNIYAYQGTMPVPADQSNFLAAINWSGYYGSSQQPSVFINGINSISFSTDSGFPFPSSTAQYDCSMLTNGSIATLRAALCNPLNWVINDFPFGPGGFCNFNVLQGLDVMVSSGQASGSVFSLGTTVNTLLATDVSGNSASCTFNITVNDTEPPTANCPSIVTASNDVGQCGANVNFSIPDPTDNGPGATALASITSGSYFPIGTTPVTVTATDAAGNTATCTFNVEVIDEEVPSISCPQDITVDAPASECFTAVSFTTPNASDNCSGVTTACTPMAGSNFDVGTTAVTCTATDVAGNTTSCTFNVTVNDVTPPAITCPNDVTSVNDPGQCNVNKVSYPAPAVSDACGLAEQGLVCVPASNTSFDVGTTPVTCTATDANGNTSTCTFNVIINDAEAPVPGCPNDITQANDAGQCGAVVHFSFPNPGDNCPGVGQAATHNPGEFYPVGTTTVTVTATDAAGNQDHCTFDIIVNDDEAPNMICNSFNLELNNATTTITPAQVDGGSTDNCGIVSFLLDNNTFLCSALGPQTVTLTGTDAAGHSASCTATITVEDNTPPVPVCKNTTIALQADGTYVLQLSDVYDANASSDNCSMDNINFTSSTYDCNDKDQTFTIVVDVADAVGNTASCNASITVAVGGALPSQWNTSDIGDSGSMGNDTSFDPCSNATSSEGEFTITGGGQNATSSTTDNVAFAGQTICGDGSITAKVESVDPNGYGGLMIRETTNAGAKQVAIFSNLSNLLRHEVRYMDNAPKQIGSFFKPSPIWLRLQRQGDWIFSYYSTTGMPNTFQSVHGVYVPMQSCVEYGLASFTYQPGQQTNATFSNVSITGTPMPTAEVPGIIEASSVKSEQGANLYPNPSSDIVNLVFEDGLRKDAIIVLRNLVGQVVEQRELRAGDFTTEWNVSALAEGLYFFEIRQDGEEIQVLRLVKTK